MTDGHGIEPHERDLADDPYSGDPHADDPSITNRVRGLTPRQEMGIVALLNTPTVSKAAEMSNIPDPTLRKWLRKDAFKRAYREARREAFSHAISLTQKYAPIAVQALAKIVADESVTPSSRVQAATALLKFARESVELDEIVERVERLERAAGTEAPGWSPADAA